MGVTGLWRLIEPAGKPVPVETLENKVLAVDISIWLHQMVKGYQDAKGAPLPNAHLMGLFQRICKLLYFRIKPVFVFDGSFPDLKKETIAKRQDSKSKYNSQSEKLKREIALLLGKKTVISTLLGKQISPKKSKPVEDKEDIFKLPALPEKEIETESESEDEESSSTSSIDLHSVDLESNKFQNMPLKEKYDLLIELKETRKMNSWGKIHTLPKKSDNFSDFQMQRLLKRRKLQECLEETEKEMGDGGMSLNDLESLLNEEGIDTKLDSFANRRIASNNTTRYLLISNIKQAIADAKKKELDALEPGKLTNSDVNTSMNKDELEDDLQKAIKMSLECGDDPETSTCASKTDDSWTSFLTDSDYSEDDDGYEQPDMTSAKAYIMQYSDFTPKAIDNIVASKLKDKNKSTELKNDEIIELNKEKKCVKVNIDLTSDVDNSIRDDTRNVVNLKSSIEVKALVKNVSSESVDICSTDETQNENKDINFNMNNTQESVICVQNSMDDIITLESSTENVDELNRQKLNNRNSTIKYNYSMQSQSSDDDFEEVTDNETKSQKPIIQLTLDMGKEVEDDIFADIFKDKNKIVAKSNLNIATSSKNEVNELMQTCNTNNVKNVEDNVNINLKEQLQEPKVIKNVYPINVTVNKDLNNDNSKTQYVVEKPSEVDFTKPLTTKEVKNKDLISPEKLNSIITEIEADQDTLLHEKGRLDRIGRNITEQMTKEAQELLQVFGIPYIIAPMEAEAQCAFLESVKLTDGTITDDSDIWLFGGRTVYKNFFNQKKHVLQFLNERIEKSFKLTREQLVLLALLVGSDYTTGVAGVGPVTALEILASFPYSKKKIESESFKQAKYQELVTGLQEFKKWVKAGKRTDNISLKKKLKNVNLSDDFPSVRVVQAYLEPNVERNEEKFTWGELDITILRDYTKAKFGWSQNKLDEIIKPVLKRILDYRSQKSIQDYFKRKIEFQSLEDQMSKRVKVAVQKMGPGGNSMQEICEPDLKKNKQLKRKSTNSDKAGSRKAKQTKKINEIQDIPQIVKTAISNEPERSIDLNIPKCSRYQEVIPQRETEKKNVLENKLKAIEIFRKTKIDRKKKSTKRKLPLPKEKADLSESDSD